MTQTQEEQIIFIYKALLRVKPGAHATVDDRIADAFSILNDMEQMVPCQFLSPVLRAMFSAPTVAPIGGLIERRGSTRHGRGMFAIAHIPARTPIGMYVPTVLLLSYPLEEDPRQTRLIPIQNPLYETPAPTQETLNTYNEVAFDVGLFTPEISARRYPNQTQIPDDQASMKLKIIGLDPLNGDPNWVVYINDSMRLYPEYAADPQFFYKYMGHVREMNVMFFPDAETLAVQCVTVQSIQPGQELLTSYGAGYFTNDTTNEELAIRAGLIFDRNAQRQMKQIGVTREMISQYISAQKLLVAYARDIAPDDARLQQVTQLISN
jgi:hypothetical protein